MKIKLRNGETLEVQDEDALRIQEIDDDVSLTDSEREQMISEKCNKGG